MTTRINPATSVVAAAAPAPVDESGLYLVVTERDEEPTSPAAVLQVYLRQVDELAALVADQLRAERQRHLTTTRQLQTLAASLDEQAAQLGEIANRLEGTEQ